MNPRDKAIEIIKKNSSFLITAHINPEGDAIGSELALALALEKMGKKADIYNRDPVPEIYRFLPKSEMIKNGRMITKKYDAFLIVDCGDMDRTGWVDPDHLPANEFFVIDHHRSESPLKDNAWIEPNASSTGEMIYGLIASMGIDIDLDIAVNLYTAIMTDTGSFRYSSTTPRVLNIASDLVEKGVSPPEIAKNVYETIPLKKLKLLALALKTVEINPDGTVAWMTVTQRMFRLTGTAADDTEEFVNHPRSIKGVEVAIFFRQKGPRVFKVSLRSKGKIDVGKIAEGLGGGGHRNASGCELKGNLSAITKQAVKLVEVAIITAKNQNAKF